MVGYRPPVFSPFVFPLGSLAVDGDARTRLAIELVEGKDAGRDSVWLLVNLPGFCCHRLVGCEDSKLCVSRGSKGSRRRRLIAVVVCLVRSQDALKKSKWSSRGRLGAHPVAYQAHVFWLASYLRLSSKSDAVLLLLDWNFRWIPCHHPHILGPHFTWCHNWARLLLSHNTGVEC